MSKNTAALRNCQFAFRCPKTWDTLQQTDAGDVRFCTDCEKNVHFCRTEGELAEAIRKNRCVAIILAKEDRPEEQADATGYSIGEPALEPYVPGR